MMILAWAEVELKGPMPGFPVPSSWVDYQGTTG
jgi:hypothetical protein